VKKYDGRKTALVRTFSTVFICLNIYACAPVPYFHKATLNSTIMGTVVDGRTKKPVSGATISIGENSVRSDANGNFKIHPIQENKYWKLLILGPFDPIPPCKNHIDIDPVESGYRVEWVEVKSCHYFRVLGFSYDKENEIIIDSIGVINLVPLKE
jgi:hypothetical protein